MTRNKLLTLSLLSIILLCISCSNEENIVEPQQMQKQAVNINITSIEQEFKTDIPTNSKASTAIDSCYLWYTIHKKSDGSLVKNRLIEKTDILNFSDTLAQGEYTYSVFASANNIMSLYSANKYSNAAALVYGGSTDIFYKSFDVKVGNTVIINPITLSRLSGKIIINIEDPQLIPENVDIINLTSNYLPDHFYISTGLMDYNNETKIPDLIGTTRKQLLAKGTNQLEVYLLPNSSDFYKGNKQLDLSISFYEEKAPSYIPNLLNRILIKKNVVIKQNVPLILSGKLFPPKSNSSNISINKEWGVSVEQPFDNN